VVGLQQQQQNRKCNILQQEVGGVA